MITNEQATVAARDTDGKLWWFPVADAQEWLGTTIKKGKLFRVARKWVLLEHIPALLGNPGTVVDDEGALSWLLASGYMPPSDLAACAAPRLLR